MIIDNYTLHELERLIGNTLDRIPTTDELEHFVNYANEFKSDNMDELITNWMYRRSVHGWVDKYIPWNFIAKRLFGAGSKSAIYQQYLRDRLSYEFLKHSRELKALQTASRHPNYNSHETQMKKLAYFESIGIYATQKRREPKELDPFNPDDEIFYSYGL